MLPTTITVCFVETQNKCIFSSFGSFVKITFTCKSGNNGIKSRRLSLGGLQFVEKNHEKCHDYHL